MANLIIRADARIHHATKAKAERLDQMLAAEYPNVRIDPQYTDDNGVTVVGEWLVTTASGDEVAMFPKVPDIADVLEAFEAEGIDPTEGEDDEEDERGGSVVDPAYRAKYREVSTTGTSCGDWLAEWLILATTSVDGFNVDDFVAICEANEVDMTAKWAQVREGGAPGWKGRFRMNGRQVLEKVLARRGKMLDASGNDAGAPADFVDAMRAKHANWLAKIAKAEAREAAKAAKAE